MGTENRYHFIKDVTDNFRLFGDFTAAAPYGSGHINDTYAVNFNQAGSTVRYICQRINHEIFRDPAGLMNNIERVCRHMQAAVQEDAPGDASRRALTLVPTVNGRSYHADAEGNHWRVYLFIEDAATYDQIQSPNQAFQAAKAFGKFQRMLANLPGERLFETIPDFHNTRLRFNALQKAVEEDVCNRAAEVKDEIRFALHRESMVDTLLNLHADGGIPERITHNDTKLNNVMLDDATGEGVCVIDLDTVMPGLALYDFGDMIRSATRPTAEDETDLAKVRAEMKMYEATMRGYLESTRDMLTAVEKAYLPFSGKLITFEIGLRFLTDYLMGDAYFKTRRPTHNRDRCRVQFRMLESLEAFDGAAERLLKKLL